MWISLLPVVILLTSGRPSLASENRDVEGLVAHGEEYDPEEYPYVVSLEITMPRATMYCTGSLISPLFVLTAAHCTAYRKADAIQVYHGAATFNNDYQYVRSIRQHKGYRRRPMIVHDISLLELRNEFKSVTQYATLPSQLNEFENYAEVQCEIVGFGDTEHSKNSARVGFVARARVKYGPTACENPDSLVRRTWKEFLCSKPDRRTICRGDSGGPMICNGSQYGIASHVYNIKDSSAEDSQDLCGDPNAQTRHVFVYAYKDWIRENTKYLSAGNRLMLHQNLSTILCAIMFYFVL